MKESKLYELAMIAVIESGLTAEEKIGIITLLLNGKELALYREARDEA